MPTGTVKFFDKEKGYGFIRQEGVVEDIFFHHTAIKMEGFRTVIAGATVQFVHKRGDKGLMAVEVLPLIAENGRPRCHACGQEVQLEVEGT